jgi:hypothetical protein
MSTGPLACDGDQLACRYIRNARADCLHDPSRFVTEYHRIGARMFKGQKVAPADAGGQHLDAYLSLAGRPDLQVVGDRDNAILSYHAKQGRLDSFKRVS